MSRRIFAWFAVWCKISLVIFLRHLKNFIDSNRTILRRHIAFHVVFRGIDLWLLGEHESLQHLDALVHRNSDGLHPLLVDEFLRASEHLPDIPVDAVQLGKVQPVKRGHQPQLVLVGSFEGLAGNIPPGADLGRQLVIAQGRAAVIDGSGAQPFQGVRVTEQAEVVEVPVLVGDEVVQHHHLVQGVGRAGNTQLFTAIAVVLVNGSLVVFLLNLHHPPGGDQLRVWSDEILAHAVGDAIVPHQGVRNVGNPHALGDFSSDHLVERLLQKGKAARLDEAAFSVDDLPALFEEAVRGVVRRAEVEPLLFRGGTKESIAYIFGKRVFKEIDAVPGEATAHRFDPIAIGQAQAVTACRSSLELATPKVSSASRNPERLAGMERSSHHSLREARSATPCRTGTPTGRCSPRKSASIRWILPVASSKVKFATGMSLCIKV